MLQLTENIADVVHNPRQGNVLNKAGQNHRVVDVDKQGVHVQSGSAEEITTMTRVEFAQMFCGADVAVWR